MSESYPEVVEGVLDDDAIVEDFISDELVQLWAPVILVAAGTGEDMPRVEPIDTAHTLTVVGVCVGPLRDATNKYAATAAGQVVQVCVFGRCKCKVDGNAANIAIGDALSTHNADGVAQKTSVDVTATVNEANVEAAIKNSMSRFAKALKASTADGDIIPVFVNTHGGTPAT